LNIFLFCFFNLLLINKITVNLFFEIKYIFHFIILPKFYFHQENILMKLFFIKFFANQLLFHFYNSKFLSFYHKILMQINLIIMD